MATLVPLALAGVIAYKHGGWNTTRWLVICLASFLVHMNTNLANDYFEFLSGADAGESIGGSRVLQDGKLTLSEIRWRHDPVLFCGLLCGLWILWVTKLWWLIRLDVIFVFFQPILYRAANPIRIFGAWRTFCGDKHGANHGGRRSGCTIRPNS